MSKKMSKKIRKRMETAAPAAEVLPADVPPVRPTVSGKATRVESEPSAAVPLSPVVRYTILGVVFFLLLSVQAGGSDRAGSIAAAVLFLIACIGKVPFWSLRHRVGIPFLTVCAYLLLNGAASLYTRFGGLAATEIAKILTAFCVFLVVVLHLRKRELPYLAAMVSTVTAAFGLLSIDASASQLLSGAFFRLMDSLFGCTFQNMTTGYEAGVRITGIFGNPNVMAGFLAFGVFLSLYLVRTAKTPRGSLGASVLLGINSLSFLLSFSMGAIAMFALSVLIYILCEHKGRRISLFLLMVETVVCVLIMTFVAFPFLGATGGAGLISVLAAPVSGLLLWALHRFAGSRLDPVLEAHGKAAFGVVAGLAMLLVVYLVLAWNVTGGYTLDAGESLRRSVYPGPGTYTLTGEWEGTATVTVESQNETETITHTSTVLYSGALEEASFTVPEGSKVVYLTFTAAEGAQLESVSLSDGTAVKLGYKLLPGFAANRIQGIWANENAIQRIAFFEDGLRIYQKSPVIGNGLSAVEGLVTSVQPFFYESKYVHNHYIQVLAEMGIPGLVIFLAMLGTSAAVLLRRRREGEEDPLLPALCACLGMTALHACTEAVWSIGQYQSMALLILAVILSAFGRPLAFAERKPAPWVACGILWIFVIFFAWSIGGNLVAEKQYAEIKAGLRQQTPYSMTELANMDRYNWAQYKLDMAVNAATSEVPEFAQTAAEYAEECRALGIWSINNSLEQYVYLPAGNYEELFAASREGLLQEASRQEAWQTEFDLYQQIYLTGGDTALEQAPWIGEQILETWEMLEEHNAQSLIPVTLREDTMVFLDRVRVIVQENITGEAVLVLLTVNS